MTARWTCHGDAREPRRVVEWLALADDGPVIRMIDTADWSDEDDHLARLRDRVQPFLTVISKRAILKQLMEDTGRCLPNSTAVTIRICATYEPTARGMLLIRHAELALVEAGYGSCTPRRSLMAERLATVRS